MLALFLVLFFCLGSFFHICMALLFLDVFQSLIPICHHFQQLVDISTRILSLFPSFSLIGSFIHLSPTPTSLTQQPWQTWLSVKMVILIQLVEMYSFLVWLPGSHCQLMHQLYLFIVFLPDGPAFSYQESGPLKDAVQSLSLVWLFVTPWTAACQASLSITNSQSLLKLMSIESVMSSNHLIFGHPLLLLPLIFPSIRLFKWVSCSHQVAKVLEFQLQHQSF